MSSTAAAQPSPLLERLRLLKKAKMQAEKTASAAATEGAVDATSTALNPPKKAKTAKPVSVTHTQVEQPSSERLDELLGDAPPAPRRNPSIDADLENARKAREALEKRLQQPPPKSSERNNVYFDPKQIKKRYGKKSALHEFIREKTSTQTGSRSSNSSGGSNKASIRSSSSGENPATAPRFDTAIAAQDNAAATSELAAAKVLLSDETGKTVKSGVRTTIDITDFVERLQQAETAGAIGYLEERLFEKPYLVSGLSSTEPNPAWEQMRIDRQVLIARRKFLMEERRSLTSGRKWFTGDGAYTTADEVRRTELRRRLGDYAPLESIELMKPDSQVRAINLRWRTKLGILLRDEYKRYIDETQRYLSRTVAQNNGTLEGLTNLYIQKIVNPVFDRYLQQIRSSTYEDQPLTAEILEQYLYDFLNYLYKLPLPLLRDPPPGSKDQPRRRDPRASESELRINRNTAQIRNLIGLPDNGRPVSNNNIDDDDNNDLDRPEQFVLGNAEQFGGPSDFNTSDQNETEIVAEYLRQALNIHASQTYIGWLRLWLEEARKQVSDAQERDDSENNQRLQIIDRLVRKMVADREELQDRRIRALGRALPRYTPIRESEISESYLQLLQNEIALARAEYLIETREVWPQVLLDFLTGRSNAKPSLDMALHPRTDLPLLLAEAKETALKQAKILFSASSDPVIGQKVEREIDERFTDLVAELYLYAPLLPANYVYFDHAPLDREISQDENAEDNAWSPYALPYPLSVDQATLQATGLRTLVMQRSPQFDADEAHNNANNLRSILSYDNAERLVLRSIAELNYYLEKIMLPERQVPFVRDVTVNSSHPIHLSTTLELRPELELAKRQPTALRDPRIDTIIDRLNTARHTVTWYFKPAYGPGAGIERVVFQEELAPGVLSASLTIGFTGTISRDPNPDLIDTLNRVTVVESQISSNAAGGGQYRAEFSEQLDAATTAVYKSNFIATIRVMACCKRDNVVFEVGSARDHGECQWREYARDEKIENIVDEWRILVTRGQAAFESLVRRRAEEQTLRKLTGVDYELFLPPWGGEDEQSMLKHFRASQGDCDFENQFTYDVITKRIVDRIGGQIRRFLQSTINQLTQDAAPLLLDAASLAEFIKILQSLAGGTNNNMELFSILVGGLRATDPMIRAIYMEASVSGSQGTWSTPERAALLDTAADQSNLRRLLSYYASALVGQPLPPVAVQSQDYDVASTYVPPLLEEDEPLPVRYIKPLEPGTNVSVASVPLATMINAMFLPSIWPNLTWREQRFFQTMQARFRKFARDLRFVERRRLYYGGLLRNDKSLDHAPTLINDDVPQKSEYNNPPMATPIFENIEQSINEQLASTTPHATQQSTIWYEKQALHDAPLTKSSFDYEVAEVYQSRERLKDVFLQDEDLCREYDEKMHDLVRSGLLVPNKSAITRFMHVRENPYLDTTWRVAALQTQNDYTTDERDNAVTSLTNNRTDWCGIHSFTTQQPDFCQIVISRDRGAAVDVRGSVPVNKGYDFRGLHAAIVNTARQYTRIVHGEEDANLVGALYDRALDRLETRLQRLELTFNFLAFVAPPLTNNVFMPIEAILSLIDDQSSENWLKSLRATTTHK